eukprot:2214819-Pleurochrysis_carterae.AAC.1
MLGLASSNGVVDVTQRALALYTAAAAGEASAGDAAEAALAAAQAEGEGAEGTQGDEAQQRLAAAGRACVAALRGALHELGTEGALAVMEE